jgi:hypothetical protein
VTLLFAQRIFSRLVGLICAIQACVVAWFGPVVVYGSDDILLAWGWVFPFVALPVAALVGWLVTSVLDTLLLVGIAGTGLPNWPRFAFLASITVALLSASSYFLLTYGDQDIRWSEEVKLRDGSKIVVTRRAIGNSIGSSKVNPTGWLPSNYEIDLSAVLSVRNPTVWRSPVRPVLLERNTAKATWVLVAEPSHCGAHTESGQSPPAFRAFELQGQAWKEVAVPKELLGRPYNLLVAPRFTGEPSVLSAEKVADRNSYMSTPVVRAYGDC